ncbi:hypothetical protein Tco_1431616 [Tanacetum coccineum]
MNQNEKPEVPPSSSSLSLSSNYGNKFLNLSSDTSLVGTTKEPTTSTSLPTPPISSEASTILTTVPDPLPVVLQRLSNLERKFEAWTKVDHSKAIKESVLANIINEVKNQLPKFLPKAFFDFVNPRIERTIHESKDKVQTGSSSKGKTQSKPSSTDKPVNAEEPLLKAEIDVEEPILDDVVNEADQPQDQAAPTQGNPTWFKQPPRPYTLDPEWNQDKAAKDGPEHTLFNDLVHAEKPPLTFDDLMSTPINFIGFAMN